MMHAALRKLGKRAGHPAQGIQRDCGRKRREDVRFPAVDKLIDNIGAAFAFARLDNAVGTGDAVMQQDLDRMRVDADTVRIPLEDKRAITCADPVDPSLASLMQEGTTASPVQYAHSSPDCTMALRESSATRVQRASAASLGNASCPIDQISQADSTSCSSQ